MSIGLECELPTQGGTHACRTVFFQRLAIAVAGLTVGALLTGGAQAITENVFRYSTPQTGYLNIPNAAFVVTDSARAFAAGDLGIHPATNVITCFVAPVNLPQTAKITAMRVWYRKANTSSYDIKMTRRKSADGTYAFPVPSQNLDDSNGAYADQGLSIDPALQTVNNLAYSYVIYVCMNNTGNLIHNLRITYTYKTAGD